MIHSLKIEKIYYDAVCNGSKRFELRKDDRNYKIGDYLKLNEIENGYITGNVKVVLVTYILRNCNLYGLKIGYCILSIK